MSKESIVRQNLIEVENYSPYCGNDNCKHRNPRTNWSPQTEQFTCSCGWSSNFPIDFITRYKKKWNK